MFRDAREDDIVWSPLLGWGQVTEISLTHINPILVTPKHGSPIRFDFYGRFQRSGEQCLFWDEVKIIPPPKPKRKVKKVVEGWAYLMRDHLGKIKINGQFYTKKPEGGHIIPCDGKDFMCEFIGPIHILHEYEVEE